MHRKDPTAFKQRFEAYKNGKSVKEIYDAGYIKEPVITPDPQYNEYINSLPDNQRLTPESQYRSHRYWELNGKPKNFAEAIGKGMFEYNTVDNSWHAKSVTFNENAGEYEFMKPNWHNTKMYEDAWYYSKDGEEFRSKYLRQPGAAYDKYIPKHKNGKLPGYEDGLTPFEQFLYNLSSETMQKGRQWGTGINLNTAYNGGREKDGGVAQSTYLLPRSIQKKVFHNEGYIDGQPGDYGLVKSAVRNRDIPVFQTAPDSIKRENLTHLGNILDGDWETSYIGDEKELVHAGGFPSAIYIDGSTGILYQKQWDLNDYGNYGSGTNYDGIKQVAANLLDKVGNPVVVTSGYQPILRYNKPYKLGDLINPDSYKSGYRPSGIHDARTLWKIVNKGFEDKGLHLENLNGQYIPMLPGIEVILDRNTKKLSTYKDGKIAIKPANRGKFNATKKRTGKTTEELTHSKNPITRKRAIFAQNAKKWKH